MKKSGLIFPSIAFIILVVGFILLWHSDNGTTYVRKALASDEVNPDAYSELQYFLYRMIPILGAAILMSLVLAFYLEEWVTETSWRYRIVTQQIAILANLPSLLYGLVGIYFVFFRTGNISLFTLTVSFVFLIIPFSVQLTQQAIRNVELSVREAAYALGANKWQVVMDHVLPHAFSSIVAGICTVISRALSMVVFIIFVFAWKNNNLNHGESFFIPSSVIILLSIALLCGVLASFFDIKTDVL